MHGIQPSQREPRGSIIDAREGRRCWGARLKGHESAEGGAKDSAIRVEQSIGEIRAEQSIVEIRAEQSIVEIRAEQSRAFLRLEQSRAKHS